MPRQLPWLVDAAKAKETKIAPPAPPKRARDSSPEDLVDADLNPIRSVTPKPRRPKPRDRTPSTSPPPAPPDIEYMHEGYSADDVYMMVEDEFYSTAKMFTQHLHHAEYVRHKKLAAARGARTLENIARPTDGTTEMSGSLKMQMEGRQRAEKIKAAIGGDGEIDDDDDDDDDYMNDLQLAGLMTGDTHVSKDLSRGIGKAKAKANTRAAAGLLQSPHNVERTKDVFVKKEPEKAAPVFAKPKAWTVFEEEELASEDDLDLPPPKSRYTKPEMQRAGKVDPVRSSAMLEPSKAANRFKQFSRPHAPNGEIFEDDRRQAQSATSFKSSTSNGTGPTNSISTVSPSKIPTKSDFLAKRRAEREKKERAEKRKVKSEIDVPTFII